MIQSIARAVQILELLNAAGTEGMPLNEVCARTGLKAPTAHNILNTLVQLDYAGQVQGSRFYTLGGRAVELGRQRGLAEQLGNAAREPMKRLADILKETLVLAIYHNGLRQTVMTLESCQQLRVGADIGLDVQFFTTATGRILLSQLSNADLDRVVGTIGMPGELWPEIRTMANLKAELRAYRDSGFVIYSKTQSHVCAVAVPVSLPAEGAPAALGAYYPLARASENRTQQFVDALRTTAAEIGTLL